MRGHFGRQRIDRPHASIAVDSYEAAVYPPRSYRCHTFDLGIGSGQSTVMLPSIDSDSICRPFTKDMQSTNKGQRKPSLRDYLLCYASPSPHKWPYTIPALEPLNVFHYPELFISNNLIAGWSYLAKMMNYPSELFPKNAMESSGVVGLLTNPERLRIRGTQRRKPPKPTRRGATVTVNDPVMQPALSSKGIKRPRSHGDGWNDGDEEGEDQENLESENEDDASVGMGDEDDDDAVDDMDSADEGPLL